MKNEKLVSEIIGQADGLNDNLQGALAEYLVATARYNLALAKRKELEIESLKTKKREEAPSATREFNWDDLTFDKNAETL